MKSVSHSFYTSREWKRCRGEYLRTHPFCEECLLQGRYTPATHVHHIQFLDRETVEDPKIALNFENLEAVCHECHNKIHFGNIERRYKVDEMGRIAPLFDFDNRLK